MSKQFRLQNRLTTIIRRIVQISAFLFINYIIIETIFSINLIAFEAMVKILPIQNSPRNPLSKGAGIVEYMFFYMAEGVFPFFLLAIFILIILFSGRWFCGWICPIGTIQDALAAIPTNKKTVKMETHNTLLNLKFGIIILLILIIVPLGISKTTDFIFYIRLKENLGGLAQKPVSFFSLSEYIFVFLPNLIEDMIAKKGLAPMFKSFWVFLIFIFYLILLIVAIYYPRVYCKYFCPFGAFASAMCDYSFLKLTRNPVRCVGRAECGLCENVCPMQIRILDEPFEFFTGKGECIFCLKCKEVCPHSAIDIKFG
ncbi:MAG: 4Fe-4S binding protein [Promethearchaeota archaeon]